MDSIKCPHCGKQVELSEAIIHELQEQVRSEEKKKLIAQFEEQRAKEHAEQEKSLREEFEKEAKEAKRKEQELIEKLEKEQENKEKEIEKAKDIALKEAKKKAEEEIGVMLKQKDIQLEQARKANDELNRKLNQSSQQLQGEALEQNLEEKLKQVFPQDEFLAVPKGIEGADIWQKVNFNGKPVGSILWETKRTKAWSKSWLTKLKDDASKLSASETILVSQVLPDDVATFDRKDGVWITNYELAINICRYVRYLITALNKSKSSISHSDEEWARLREYMLSDDFKHKMRTHFESVMALKNNLDAEERSAKQRWRKERSLLDKLDNNTYDFYLDLKNIVPNLPEIEAIETPLLQVEDENQETLL